jgi:hypothetical protein
VVGVQYQLLQTVKNAARKRADDVFHRSPIPYSLGC